MNSFKHVLQSLKQAVRFVLKRGAINIISKDRKN